MNFNKTFLGGRLTRDPELRYLPGGMEVCEFGVVTNRTWKDKSTGTIREETCFVDCTAWGRTAETIAKHLKKGREIFIEGRLKFDQWDDRTTGKKRSRLTVTVESFQFVGGRDQAQAPRSAERLGPPPPPGTADHLPPQDTTSTPF